MNKRLLERIACVLLCALLLVSFVGCSSAREVRPTARAKKPVATAGNVEIRYDELYYLAMTRADELREEHKDAPLSDEALREELNTFVWEKLLDRQHALLSLAKDYGVSYDSGEIGERIDEWMERVIEENFGGDRKAYIASLNEAHLTDVYVRTYIAAEDYVATEIIKRMLDKNELTSDDAAARAIVESEEFIRTVQVFVSKTNGNDDATNRANAEKVASTLAAISDPTARYAAMRAEIGGAYNNDYSDTLGDGYYFARGEMQNAYEAAAFALQNTYDVSGVVETEDGYYVIMRLEKDAAYITEHLESLKSKIYFARLNAAVEKRHAELKESFARTEFGDSLDLVDLPVITADGGEGLVTVISVAVVVLLVGGVAIAAVFVWKRVRAKKK